MGLLKKNVNQFNEDASSREGYSYSTNASYSSKIANQRMTEAIFKNIPIEAKTLIDVGCGDGVYTQELSERYPQFKIIGIDAAEKAIVIAKKNYPKIDFLLADVTERFLADKFFDVAVIRGLLHHTSHPESIMKNVAKISRRCIIIEPNGNNPILKAIEKLSPYHRAHEEKSFSSLLLKKWCTQNGLKILSLEYIGFVPMFFPTVLAKAIYVFQPLLEKIPLVKHFLSAQIVIVCESSSQPAIA
jgi:2-polyprenyl-3-methyl-5-hydroxy-6-metoxy-1,4-benzoquinol methylase